ncbi:MAG: helix-turn-helix domain-containing protein, partial [Rhodanobacter sp.]
NTGRSSDADHRAGGRDAGPTKTKFKDLAAIIGITEANLSRLKQGKVKNMRFGMLAAIGAALGWQPGDLLEYIDEDQSAHSHH